MAPTRPQPEILAFLPSLLHVQKNVNGLVLTNKMHYKRKYTQMCCACQHTLTLHVCRRTQHIKCHVHTQNISTTTIHSVTTVRCISIQNRNPETWFVASGGHALIDSLMRSTIPAHLL